MSISNYIFSLFAIVLVSTVPYVIISFTRVHHKDSCSTPSSCGNLPNISSPFRLKGDDHRHCYERHHKLVCEENHTILYLYNGRYYVEAISYDKQTITIKDSGLVMKTNSTTPSLPLYSLTRSNFSYDDPYDFVSNPPPTSKKDHRDDFMVVPIAFVTCPFGMIKSTSNSSQDLYYMDVTISNTSSNNIGNTSTYVVPGTMRLGDLEDSCVIGTRLDVVVTRNIFSEFCYADGLCRERFVNNLSFYDLYLFMQNGVELTWYRVDCMDYYTGDDHILRRNIYPGDNLLCYPHDCFYQEGIRCIAHYYPFRIIFHWNKRKGIILGFIMAGRTFCGFIFLLAIVIYKFHRRHLSSDEDIEKFIQDHTKNMPIRYSHSQIKSITKGFKHKLGQGGFGSVFKGTLRSGRRVAVKMLRDSKTNGQEFINEVATIGRIHHVNVVKLIGFCVDGQKTALIYDFMPNGSLEKYVFSQGETNATSLTWEKMFEIALAVARGIEYLHQGCDMKILHFDIKPHNILLDENFVPKISDFGLAKLYPIDESIVTLTAARGTLGYIAPELFYTNIGGISIKSDIYSFGMMLMEMAGRRKNVNANADRSSQIYFPLWIYDRFTRGEDIDFNFATNGEREIAKKLAVVALWCIQMKPIDRPSINKVLEMLECPVDCLKIPPKPFLSSERFVLSNEDCGSLTYIDELSTSPTSKLLSFNNSMESMAF